MKRHMVMQKQGKVRNPGFRVGSDYYEIWRAGHTRPVCRKTLVRNLARRLRKSQRLVSYDLDVLRNPKSQSNLGKCHADKVAESEGKILLVAGA